ncbi:sodium:glutamate symporter [Roseiconus nitratireducens]|uniref:Sodium:glutamate symporter n=1 Tax=Roseiconus nitratireducens TaxID=2605748 RepID=A0A5M6DAG0_9BACT|nr:sodium/glutamate symporter [Roseiconus nitratireducens]KAA5544363.1 sodium:glutamate symporter [Roseiconus nitratireducens]
MTAACLTVAGLLLGGLVLRQRLRPLRRFYIPASVIAGFLGFALGWLFSSEAFGVRLFGPRPAEWTAEINATLSGWPGPLIAVVFAAMLLQQPSGAGVAGDREIARRVGLQGLMVWIIVLGETLVGLAATWLFIQPLYDVPNSFGMLIETGFAGGHGTALAMGQVFASPQVGLAAGEDLGLMMATCGLVYGIVSGIVWINLAARLGWIGSHTVRSGEDREVEHDQSAIGYATLPEEAIDPLLLQLMWIALAVGVGVALQSIVMTLAGTLDRSLGIGALGVGPAGDAAQAELSKRLSFSNVTDFPLFIYTMFGGWAVRRILHHLGQGHRIDSKTVQRISSTAMEVLVVAAITSLEWSKVAELLGPLAILFVCGAIWTAVCLLLISRWILPRRHWFPLALINYGMSTGTTATGFVLLRIVDPQLKTPAASDYALAAPLSAPFIGGGMLTIALPLLLLERVSIIWPTLSIAAVVLTLVLVGVGWRRRTLLRDEDRLD